MIAEYTLTELIDNNKKVLDLKINESIILDFVKLMLENKQTKFVNLVRAVSVCNGVAIMFN